MTTPFIQDHVGKENKAANATISHTVNHLIPGIYEVSGLIRVLNEAGGDTPSEPHFMPTKVARMLATEIPVLTACTVHIQ